MAYKTYIVKITAQAEEQLQEIIKYITSELKAPKAALCLLHEIEHSVSSLSQFPQRITLTEEEPWCSYGIFSFTSGLMKKIARYRLLPLFMGSVTS